MILKKYLSSFILLASLLLSTSAVTTVQADLNNLSITLQAQKNRLYYGQSETANNPAISLYSRYELSRYLYSGIDFSDVKSDDQRQRQRNVNAFIAGDFPLTKKLNSWYLGGSVRQRWFLNSGRPWDYQEWGAQLWHPYGFSFRAEYAPDFYALDTTALLVNSRITRPINNQLYWQADISRFSSGISEDIYFSQLLLGISTESVNTEIGWHYNPNLEEPVPGGESAHSQLTLQVSWQVF